MKPINIFITIVLLASGVHVHCQSLLPQFEGMSGVTWFTPLIADSLPPGVNYEFEVTTAAGHFVEIVNSEDNVFSLSETGLAGDIERHITVRARTVTAGVISPFGAPVSFRTAGSIVKPCGSHSDIGEELNTAPMDDSYRQWREEQIQQFIPIVEAYRGGGGGCTTSYRISVVFHVVYDPAVPASNIPDAFLLDQLQILNNEFNGPNVNTLGGNSCIEFCLAQNTPNGEDWLQDFNSPTPGITRSPDNVATYHGDGSAAMAQLANVVMFPTDIYLNIWVTSTVKDGPLHIVGYATFPGSGLPLDGVVIEYPFMAGYGGIHEYMEGFVAVHEVGHYLSLRHTFEGGCAIGDFCSDTPPVDQPNTAGCTDLTPNSCGVPEQLENYMDYTYEFCKSTFTNEQIARMHATLLTFRTELSDPSNHILTGITGPGGCTDPMLTATIIPSGTQFCTNATTGQFNGVLAVDEYHFTFLNPNGGTLPPVDYGPALPMIPTTGTLTFPTAGPWTITLTVANSITLPTGSTSATITDYVSDCGAVLMEQSQWYFGNHCALDFTSGLPVAVGGSAMLALEGCASVSNGLSGMLAFYASNDRAYNSGHVTLNPQLTGGPFTSSSQGALIIPDQTNPDLYYLFTTREKSTLTVPSELHYSQVDMGLNAGGFAGNLVSPMTNVSVGVAQPITTEHLAAVPHCNGVDHWVVTHGFDAATFDQLISYRLTAGGVVASPILSPAFPVAPVTPDWPPNNTGIGVIKFNHEGDLAAITHAEDVSCQLYSFDRETGAFTYLLNLPAATTQGYGVTFSPSGNFLYTTTSAGIWQHDIRNLDLCNPQVPNNFTAFPSSAFFPALQLGPDDKIYMSRHLTDFVSVINYPEAWNSSPNAFGFNWQGVTVEVPGNGVNEDCRLGLPNMIDARPTPGQVDFTWCGIDCENVTFSLIGCGASIVWDVECNSTVDGTGNVFTHAFPAPGSYCVSLTVDGVTVTHNVDILIPPTPDIEPDIVCMGVPVVFTSTNTAGLSHSWSLTGAGVMTGPENGPSTEIWWTGPGNLSLEVTDVVTGCDNSITVPINPITFQPNAGPDLTVCPGENITLTELNGAANCVWAPTTDLDLTAPCAPVYSTTTLGTYTYTLSAADANGCSGSDEVTITVDDNNCAPLTLTKTVTPPSGNTYAGAPVMFTIQACNNDVGDQVVNITDEMPAGFVPAFNSPNNPYWPTASVTIPAGECVTTEITGYFTQIGPHTNTVTMEQVPGISLSAEATITLLQGCPMLVYGSGGCLPGTAVGLCLGMHTQLTNVESVDYYIVYPDFLEPPAPGSIMGNISSPFGISAATIGTPTPLPWPSGPDYGYATVPVHVAFTAPVSASPPYSFFCVGFHVGSAGLPPGVNAVWTWASTTPSVSGWNRVTVNMTGGSNDLWTQAYHILFTGCPGINGPNANFTAQTSSCGGTVTVSAELTDPDAIHIWTWGDERTTPTNGAPTWTYDYFGPITDNQGWPVNIPPAAPGTYTITHTVILDGVASNSTQAVTVQQCCTAALSIPHGTLSSTLPSTISGTVDIQGQFIIDQNLSLNGVQVTMEPGAEIIVQPGRFLVVRDSELGSCNGTMWKSITANSGSYLEMQRNTVKDAEYAVTALDGASVLLFDNDFTDNRVSLYVPNTPVVAFNSVSAHVIGNRFNSTGTLAQAYPGQTTTLGNVGFAAVLAWKTALDLTGYPEYSNTVDGMSNGILAFNSDLSVARFNFRNVQPDGAYSVSNDANGSGIHAYGRNGAHYLRQTGNGKQGLPSFQNCRWGIYTLAMNTDSRDNNMQGMGTGYRVDKARKTTEITNNKVAAKLNGMEFNQNAGTLRFWVTGNDITFGTLAELVPAPLCNGILVADGNSGGQDSRIEGNAISMSSLPLARTGINLLAARN